jgi:hypothetical protein
MLEHLLFSVPQNIMFCTMLPEVHLKMNIPFRDGKCHISTNHLQKWTMSGKIPLNVCHLLRA